MLRVLISLAPEGYVEALQANGHAGGERPGENVVCAAATVLVRTAIEVLHARAGVRCVGDAPAVGELSLAVREVPPASLEWVRGVTDFLLQGCVRIQSEAPGAVSIQIQRRG